MPGLKKNNLGYKMNFQLYDGELVMALESACDNYESEGITDSLAIGQRLRDDQRIILFVKLAEGYELNEDLIKKIKVTLRKNASPRHVPA
ncbi:MAG: hypothetical protein JSW28_10505, partial [Thermoplasmata archaeon]